MPLSLMTGRHTPPDVLADLTEFGPVTPVRFWYVSWKVGIDAVLAALLLIVLGPVIVLGAVLVKLTSRGPAFYRQVRLGRNGRRFTLFKLRTMVRDAEAKTGAVWCTGHNDPRVTGLGRFLRKTHIDEFPQLVNVLLGNMSLIGPRPERPEIIEKLDWEIPLYRERLKVRPGISGLAQLRLPADSDLEGVRRKLVHDLFYVRNVSPWLDFRLLVLTGWSLLKEVCRPGWKYVELPTQHAIETGFQQAIEVPAIAIADAGETDDSAMTCAGIFPAVSVTPMPELVECRDFGE